jgi:hypothetical protein
MMKAARHIQAARYTKWRLNRLENILTKKIK